MGFLDEGMDKLEDKYKQPFNTWKAAPTPQSTALLLKTVQPEIVRGISAHVGQGNPNLNSKAKRMALQAMRNYDPTRASLGTHIVNSLQGLKRVARRQTQILPMPERVVLDQGHVERAKAELEDELGREATVSELADKTGLSTKRINYVNKFRYAMPEGMFASMGEESEDGGFMPAVDQGQSNSWLEFVYADLDPTSQKIMEWTLGMNGAKQLSNQAIARKLGMTPGAVSQRKFKIQQALNQEQYNPFAG